MRRINNLCPCPCTNQPARLVIHRKSFPDWHFYLALASDIRNIPLTIHTSTYFACSKIFLSELFLHMCTDIWHNIVLLLLDASPKTNCIGILKKHTLVISIERQIDQKYKDEDCPCDNKGCFHRHIAPGSFFHKHTTTPIPNNKKGAKGSW